MRPAESAQEADARPDGHARLRGGNPGVLALKGAVVAYQWTLRPFLGAHCRFHPTCSHYALEALTAHGALKGSWLAGRRILRCNPWHPGGYDPVPPADRSAVQGPTAKASEG